MNNDNFIDIFNIITQQQQTISKLLSEIDTLKQKENRLKQMNRTRVTKYRNKKQQQQQQQQEEQQQQQQQKQQRQ